MPSVTFTFKGRQAHSLDEKGRLILPNQFRVVLAASREPATVYLGSMPGTGFVSVYPAERWEELCQLWKDEKRFPDTRTMLNGQRMFFSNIEQAAVDRTGRVTVPAHFRTRANLKDEVAVIGVADKMEIWNPDDLDAFESEGGPAWGHGPAGESARPSGVPPEEVRLPQF
ncbi:MAG: hypothetical protein LBF58_11960 [Deltaproteobacteria bacterium]|jgi:MraZ protein|nr:hypothetical protein [Deltaproteobacteria bacterium]